MSYDSQTCLCKVLDFNPPLETIASLKRYGIRHV